MLTRFSAFYDGEEMVSVYSLVLAGCYVLIRSPDMEANRLMRFPSVTWQEAKMLMRRLKQKPSKTVKEKVASQKPL